MTLSTRKGAVVDVTDYGARGDGSSDDTYAIQKAVSALESMSPPGGTLCFPKGAFVVHEQGEFYGVRFRSGNFTVRGAGAGLSTIVQANNSSPVFYFKPCCDDSTDLLIEHLSFRRGDDTPDSPSEDVDTERGSLVAVRGLDNDFYTQLTVQNCYFDCPLRAGLFLANIRVAYIHANLFKSDAPAYHILANKPLSGQWKLTLLHNLWQDCNGTFIEKLVKADGGTGTGLVSVYDDVFVDTSGQGEILFGIGTPEGNKTATYAQYWDVTPGQYASYIHASPTPSNTGWVQMQ